MVYWFGCMCWVDWMLFCWRDWVCICCWVDCGFRDRYVNDYCCSLNVLLRECVCWVLWFLVWWFWCRIYWWGLECCCWIICCVFGRLYWWICCSWVIVEKCGLWGLYCWEWIFWILSWWDWWRWRGLVVWLVVIWFWFYCFELKICWYWEWCCWNLGSYWEVIGKCECYLLVSLVDEECVGIEGDFVVMWMVLYEDFEVVCEFFFVRLSLI